MISHHHSSLRFRKRGGFGYNQEIKSEREGEGIGNNSNKIGQCLAYKNLNEKLVTRRLNFIKIMSIL